METQIHYGQYVVPSSDIIVNFGVGQPSNNELPLNIIKEGCSHILELNDKSLLQYGDISGYLEFRKVLASFLEKRYKKNVNPHSLFITNGVSGALSLICSLYIKKCKKIYVEEPTYFLAINIFKDFGFDIELINLDSDGINLQELENKLKKDNNDIKLLYTIPSFHNPTSITMSHNKRVELSKLSQKYNIHIIADEVYQLLYFEDSDKPPLPLHYYSENVYSLSSFSKILAPALRLGWIQSSNKLLNILKSCGQLDSSGGVNPFISRIVHNVINKGNLDIYLDHMREVLKDRCDCLINNLNIGEFEKPKGGYFVWIKTLIDSRKMLDYCYENKVKYHSGNKFSSDNKLENYIRLSYSFYEKDDLILGVERLNRAYAEFREKSNKIFVGIYGFTGKLGSKICEYVSNNTLYVLNKIKKDINYKPGIGKNVIIDVSHPDGTKNLLIYLLHSKYYIPIIIGTTGDLPMNIIKEYSKFAPVALISNFSYGIPLLEKVLKRHDFSDWKISITEIHHDDKKDTPSGTAKTLSKVLGGVTNIKSIRDNEIVGIHKITLENNNELIELNHIAKTRDIFALGCLRYIDWIINKIPDIYDSLEEKKIYIEKWNGCGNTFIIINDKYKKVFTQSSKYNIKKICNETNSDGVIYYKILNDGKVDFEWQYNNNDGSIVEMCGNGVRCISKFIHNKIKKNQLKFKNNFGIEQEALINNDFVEVKMPKYENYTKYNDGYFVKVGVPHYVINVSNVNAYDLKKIYTKVNNYLASKYIESVSDINNSSKYDISWEKCNVNIYHIKNNICYVRTYINGFEGECGSGCCAIFYKLNKERVEFITSSKSKLSVVKKDNNIYLSSKVKREFRAYI